MFALLNQLDRNHFGRNVATPWSGVLGGGMWREFDRLFQELDRPHGARVSQTFGSAFNDLPDRYELRLMVPGVAAEDIDVQLHEGVLTVVAKRQTNVPEGYQATHLERQGLERSESYRVPEAVGADATATLRNGVLTVTLKKTAETKPMQISVRAG